MGLLGCMVFLFLVSKEISMLFSTVSVLSHRLSMSSKVRACCSMWQSFFLKAVYCSIVCICCISFIHLSTEGSYVASVRDLWVVLLWTWMQIVSSRSCFVFFWVYIPKWDCWVLGPSFAILIEHVQASESSRSYELAHMEGHGLWLWYSLPERLIVQMVSLWLVSCCARPPETNTRIVWPDFVSRCVSLYS